MSLEELQETFLNTNVPADAIEDKIVDEVEDMLDDRKRREVREEIEDLENQEFRQLALQVLENV